MNSKRFQICFFAACIASISVALGFCHSGWTWAQAGVVPSMSIARGSVEQIPVSHPIVVRTYPHDPHAFTQGLEFYGGYLYESTGIAGESTLRRVALESGKVVQQVALPPQYFGEGLTIFRGKIYQLTWLAKTGFIYDLRSFRRMGDFHYDGEGWGLAHDDKSLILSDGTNKIRFIDLVSFAVTRTIEVYADGEAIVNLNELEYIDGEIFANVWHSPRIARIDCRSGRVLGWIDLTPVVAKEQHGDEDVLNGIAYDKSGDRLFITGKHWSKVFEIRLQRSAHLAH
jgi:glutaminyl-peptide cyclotransferase